MYFQNDGVTPLVLPYDAVLTFSVGAQIATFFAPAGTSLSDATKWTGTDAALIAANYSGLATHTTNADFSKLPFAVLQGWTYSAAQVIVVKIQALKNGELSQNSGPFLQMPIKTSVGKLNFPNDIDVRNYGGVIGTFVHSSLFSTESVINQGIVDIQDTTDRQSKNRILTDVGVTVIGTHARYFADTASPTGFSVIWNMNADAIPQARTETFRSQLLGLDVDGFLQYGIPENINAVGAPGPSTSSPSGLAVVEALTNAGMPIVLICKITSTRSASITVNVGTAAAPNYSSFLRTDSIEASLEGLTLPRSDSSGVIYLPRGGAGSIGQFSRITYTGLNNNVTQLIDALNWNFERLGDTATATPAADGTGATFQGRPYGVAINEDDVINSEPTLYVTDDLNHVLFEVTRNANSFGDERDWDWTIVVGQTGVAGNTDGTGTAATLNGPRGIDYENGFLYLNNRIAHTVRKIRVSDFLTETYFGVASTPGTDMQFNF